jgi:putative ABC transport system permease protein
MVQAVQSNRVSKVLGQIFSLLWLGAKGPGSQVSGSAGSAQSLTVADATAIQDHVSGVANVSPEVSSNQQIVATNANSNSSIYGVQSVYATVHNVEMQEGSFISDKNNLSLARVVVLGPTLSQDLFGVGAEAIGQTVRIDNLEFTVVGITKAKGGSGFTNPDSAAYIPLSTAQQMITGNQYVSPFPWRLQAPMTRSRYKMG